MGGDAVGGDFNAFIGFLYIEVFRQGFVVDAGILVQYDCCLVRNDVEGRTCISIDKVSRERFFGS